MFFTSTETFTCKVFIAMSNTTLIINIQRGGWGWDGGVNIYEAGSPYVHGHKKRQVQEKKHIHQGLPFCIANPKLIQNTNP